MLATLIRKELAEMLGSLKFQLAAVSCLILFLSTGVLLIQDFDHQVAEYNTKRLVHQSIIERVGKPLLANGLVWDLPLTPLQGFFPGAQGRSSKAVSFSYLFDPEQVESVEGLKTEELFSTFSLAFLFTILMPLVAALLAHDLISREMQQGTLRLIMANSVSRVKLLWAKWLGGFLPLLLLLFVCSLGVLAEIQLMARYFSVVNQAGQLAWIFLVAVLLLSIFFTFGLMISSFCQNSANALVGTLAGWLAFTFIVPSVGAYLSEVWRPLPSVHEIANRKLLISLDFEAKEEKVMHNFAMKPEEWDEEREKLRKEMDEEKNRLDRWFAQQLQGQVDLAHHLTLASPVAVAIYLLSDLAGTGIRREQLLVQTISRYWEEFKHFGFVEIGMKSVEPQWFANHLPAFVVSSEEGIELPHIALLIFFNVLFGIIAYSAFLRYKLI